MLMEFLHLWWWTSEITETFNTKGLGQLDEWAQLGFFDSQLSSVDEMQKVFHAVTADILEHYGNLSEIQWKRWIVAENAVKVGTASGQNKPVAFEASVVIAAEERHVGEPFCIE